MAFTWPSDRRLTLVFFVVVCITAYFAIFLHLDSLSMQFWDESGYTLNAHEMLMRGDPIVVYLNGQPDLWNSKPPLALWLMACSLKAFGFNEFGARFASAVCAFVTVLLLFGFTKRLTGHPVAALIAAFVLCSSAGYMGHHIARTGDTDSVLTLWVLCYCYSFYAYCTGSHQGKYLLLTALFLSFACLTKGIAGLTALPGMAVFALIRGLFRNMIQAPAFYAAFGIFVLLVPGYYALRESMVPGYLDAVFQKEIGWRINKEEILNPHAYGFTYYLQNLMRSRFAPWAVVLPLSLLGVKILGSPQLKKATLYFSCVAAGILLLISASQTKEYWYDAPLYPLMAVIIAFGFIALYHHIVPKLQRTALLSIFVFYFCFPYSAIVNENLESKFEHAYLGTFMKKIRNEYQIKDHLFLVNGDANLPMVFYLRQDKMNGYSSEMSLISRPYKAGDLLITSKKERTGNMLDQYEMETVARLEECLLFRVKKKRETCLLP